MLERVLVDAGARVGHPGPPRLRDRVGAEGHGAALRHGVAGVDGQIHEDLRQLVGVGLDDDVVGREIQRQLDVASQGMHENGGDVVDQAVGANGFDLARLPAREGKDLGRQALRLLGGLLHAAEVLPGRVGEAVLAHENHLAVAEDDREQVVEVVRDAAREPADRLHPLRLPEPLLALSQGHLGRASLGDVSHHEQPADDSRRGRSEA